MTDSGPVKDAERRKQKRDHLGRFVRLCVDCGIFEADPPSKRCPGCQAYREHLQ